MSESSLHTEARAAARLRAVQALYNIHYHEEIPVVWSLEDEGKVRLDEKFYKKLKTEYQDRQEDVDRLVIEHLDEGFVFDRLGPLLQAILRLAVVELLAMPAIPKNVILHEYVTMAESFFNPSEVGFVNGMLEAIARTVRTIDE